MFTYGAKYYLVRLSGYWSTIDIKGGGDRWSFVVSVIGAGCGSQEQLVIELGLG